jgi:ribosomal protein S21
MQSTAKKLRNVKVRKTSRPPSRNRKQLNAQQRRRHKAFPVNESSVSRQ